MDTSPNIQMKDAPSLGIITRLLFAIGSGVLIISGSLDLQATSQGNQYGDYFDESSFAAIGIRSQGGFKLGLGIALLGASAAFIDTQQQHRQIDEAIKRNEEEMKKWDSKN